MLPATAAAGGSGVYLPTNFELSPGYSCIDGQGASNHELRVKLYSAAGTFKSGFKVTTDSNGYWNRCFYAGANPGDRLWASDGTTTRNFTVPNLTLKINRTSDVVSGTAPSHSSVYVIIENCQDDPTNCSGGESGTLSTNGKGAYSRDFTSTYNIRGGDWTNVTWWSPQGDRVEVSRQAPRMSTQVGEAQAWGVANSGAQVTMWLFDKNGNQISTFHDRADRGDGEFGGMFKKKKVAASVEVGDYVGSDIASDALFKVIDSKATFNTSTDTITAKCFANAGYLMFISDEEGQNYSDTIAGVASGNGSLSVDTQAESSWDLLSGDQVSLVCRLASGDDQTTNYEVP